MLSSTEFAVSILILTLSTGALLLAGYYTLIFPLLLPKKKIIHTIDNSHVKYSTPYVSKNFNPYRELPTKSKITFTRKLNCSCGQEIIIKGKVDDFHSS